MPETADPKDIPESDRAYLPDGRWVEKQPDLVDEWRDAVRYDHRHRPEPTILQRNYFYVDERNVT